MSAPTDNAELKRRIRHNALLLGAVAVMFFIGFIAVSAVR